MLSAVLEAGGIAVTKLDKNSAPAAGVGEKGFYFSEGKLTNFISEVYSILH